MEKALLKAVVQKVRKVKAIEARMRKGGAGKVEPNQRVKASKRPELLLAEWEQQLRQQDVELWERRRRCDAAGFV